MTKKSFILTAALMLMSMASCAQQTIELPQPDLKLLNKSLGDALMQRRSGRSYDASRPLTDVQLSTLLWAACGVSDKQSGKITAPSAVNMQDIRVYVCTPTGVCLYNARENRLEKVSDDNLMAALADRQDFAKDAPVNLLLVSWQEDRPRKSEKWGKVDSGYVSQNIYLAATAMGLQTVARGTMDEAAVRKALNLPTDVLVLLNHPVGYAK